MRRFAGPLALAVSGALVWSGCGHSGDASGGRPDAGTMPDAAPAPDAAASPDPGGPPPPLFNPQASLSDAQLASQARSLLDLSGAGCRSCHSIAASGLRSWATLGGDLLRCLGDRDLGSQASAQRMVACLCTDPSDPSSSFTPRKLGWVAAAARLDWFAYLFKRAYGADWQAPLTALRSRVAMPRGGMRQLTQAEFDVVAEWFNRGLPQVASVLPAELQPGTCADGRCPGVATGAAAVTEQDETKHEGEHDGL